MIMTSINGYQKGYWYEEGYIRTSSENFSMRDLENRYVHLTNDAVQKHSDDYGKFEYGNKISFSDFNRYLSQTYPDKNLDFQKDFVSQMKTKAAHALKSVYGKIDPHKRQNCFEIFGLDFMIDRDFKTWLIEINTNPCLETSSPLLVRLIPQLVENAFRLAVDPVFPPPIPWPKQKKFIYKDRILETNRFSIIFDEREDGEFLRKLYQTNPHYKSKNINCLLPLVFSGLGSVFTDIDEESEEEEEECVEED